MKTFGEYMYYLLSYPFKQVPKNVNQWYVYFHVVGLLFDRNKAAFQAARSESTVSTASHVILAEHGKERGLERYAGESYENFRKRISMYGEICKMGGTAVGTRMAVEALGFDSVQIVPCYLMDGNRERWAEFYVVVTRDVDDLFDINHDIIRKEVRRVKKVSARDNYLFKYVVPPAVNINTGHLHRIVIRSDVRWYRNTLFDGQMINDGSSNHGNVIANHPTCWRFHAQAVNTGKFAMKCTNYHRWRTNNGAVLNDGTGFFDACAIEEEI